MTKSICGNRDFAPSGLAIVGVIWRGALPPRYYIFALSGLKKVLEGAALANDGHVWIILHNIPPWYSETRKSIFMEREMPNVFLRYSLAYNTSLLSFESFRRQDDKKRNVDKLSHPCHSEARRIYISGIRNV